MKLADIQVGAEYLASSSTSWQEGAYMKRVRVVDVTTRLEPATGWSRHDEVVETEFGQFVVPHAWRSLGGSRKRYVIVQHIDKHGHWSSIGSIVATAAIRATWEEGFAIVQESRKHADDTMRAKALKANAQVARVSQCQRRLSELGLQSTVLGNDGDRASVEISLLESLLDLAETLVAA